MNKKQKIELLEEIIKKLQAEEEKTQEFYFLQPVLAGDDINNLKKGFHVYTNTNSSYPYLVARKGSFIRKNLRYCKPDPDRFILQFEPTFGKRPDDFEVGDVLKFKNGDIDTVIYEYSGWNQTTHYAKVPK